MKQNIKNNNILTSNVGADASVCPHTQKEYKENKGITLVALIITIIILLILAVVSVNLIVHEGIITKTQKAKDDYIIAQEKEKIELGYSEYNSGDALKEMCFYNFKAYGAIGMVTITQIENNYNEYGDSIQFGYVYILDDKTIELLENEYVQTLDLKPNTWYKMPTSSDFTNLKDCELTGGCPIDFENITDEEILCKSYFERVIASFNN